MRTPSPLTRRSLAPRWTGAAPWATVRGAIRAVFEPLPWFTRWGRSG